MVYNLDQIKKSIRNTDTVIYKLKLTLIKVINYRLEVTRKKKLKKEEIVEKQRIKAIAA